MEQQNWGTAGANANDDEDDLSRIQSFDLDGDLSHLIGKTITAPLGGGGGGELWSTSRRSNRTGNGLGRSTQSLPDTFDGSCAESDIEPFDYRESTPVGVGGSITDGRSSPAGGIISLSDSTHLSDILTSEEMWGDGRHTTSDRSKFIKSERLRRRRTADDLHELMYGDMFDNGTSVQWRGKLLELDPPAKNYAPIGGTKRRKSLTDLAEYYHGDLQGMGPNFDTESSVSGVSAVSGKSAPPTLDLTTTFDQSMSKSKRTAAALEALHNSYLNSSRPVGSITPFHSELTNMSVSAATMASPAMDPAGPSMSGCAMGEFMSGSTMRDQSMQGSTTGGPSVSDIMTGSMSGPIMTGPSITASSMPEANGMMAPAMSAPQINPSAAMAKLHNSMVRTSFSQHLLQEYDRANVSGRFFNP